MGHWSKRLEDVRGHRACESGLRWAAQQPDARTAWRECLYGDQLLWVAAYACPGEPGSPERDLLLRAVRGLTRQAVLKRASHDSRFQNWLRALDSGDLAAVVDDVYLASRGFWLVWSEAGEQASRVGREFSTMACAAESLVFTAYAAYHRPDVSGFAALAANRACAASISSISDAERTAALVRDFYPEPPEW